MTSKEALENIKENYPFVSPVKYQQIRDSYIVLEKLVDRDTPKKRIINTHNISGSNHVIRQHNCSVCLSRLDIPQLKEVNFCPKCGQRVDWEIENKGVRI